MSLDLGTLISILEKEDPNKIIKNGFTNPHSYRGYYKCLAFEPTKNTTVGDMLECAKSALGTTFTGYKGGEFTMGEYSEVYIALYGHSGDQLGRLLLNYILNEVGE